MATSAFTFVCGNDDFLVSREGHERWAALTKDVTDDFAREIVDGAAGNVSEVDNAVGGFIAAIRTLPMFGDRKCVWLKNVSFMADTPTGRAEGAKAQVEKLLAALESANPAEVGILITACPVDRRRRDYKWLQSKGESVFVGGEKDGTGALSVLEDALRQERLRIAPEAAHLLLEKIHHNTRLALEETRKLSLYLGGEGGEVTIDMVNLLVPPFGEGDFFEASEAFFNLRLSDALEAIHRHFFSGYDIRPLITSLQNRTRLLIQLRVLLDAGEFRSGVSKASMERAASVYGGCFDGAEDKSNYNVFTQNPYYLSRLVQTAKELRLRQLIDFQTAFLRAFEEALARPNEHEQVMREAAIRCLG